MSKGQLEKIDVICDICKQTRTIARGTHQKAIKRNGFYRCARCSPQRSKLFWQDESRKIKHSEAVKSSSDYHKAILERDQSGKNNGMFGKKHNADTIDKMSKSRTGKIGEKATAWKGGKSSFTKRVKRLIQLRYDWFSRVIERDNSQCTHCGSKENLDAHHIDPIVKIINRIIIDQIFKNEEEKLEWVIIHPEIEDKLLVNGIVLCRSCHKKAHSNWGSHVKP